MTGDDIQPQSKDQHPEHQRQIEGMWDDKLLFFSVNLNLSKSQSSSHCRREKKDSAKVLNSANLPFLLIDH